MERKSLREKYTAYFKELTELSQMASVIDETNVYQRGNPNTRRIMDKLVQENLSPESRIFDVSKFEQFYDAVTSGQHGLILMEHYSNTDLPALCYLLEHSGSEKLKDLSSRIVAIAGMKLNQDNPVVKAFAESFTRVVIYPTRSLTKNEAAAHSAEEAQAEEQKARKINLAAMRAMDNCKRRGEVILVFPSGTRYREGHPETKKGLREIDSYLRLFDVVLLVSINGNILKLQDEDMLNDLVGEDTVIIAASDVIDCKSFRKNFMDSLPQTEEDPKQKIIDHVMELLENQHEKIEKYRS